jgi:hypothetical protein
MPAADPPLAQRRGEWQSDQQFIAMLNAYRPSGGLARAQEVASRCKPHGWTAVSSLADWIIKRKVVCVEWQAKIWLPWFQFNPAAMTLQQGFGDVMSELVAVYDDWEVANWFAKPNPWLADCTPADSLANAAPEVLGAARAERFLAAG